MQKNELNQFEVLSPSLAATSKLTTLTASFRKRSKKIRIQIKGDLRVRLLSAIVVYVILFRKLF